MASSQTMPATIAAKITMARQLDPNRKNNPTQAMMKAPIAIRSAMNIAIASFLGFVLVQSINLASDDNRFDGLK
jgi:hypothetical protein